MFKDLDSKPSTQLPVECFKKKITETLSFKFLNCTDKQKFQVKRVTVKIKPVNGCLLFKARSLKKEESSRKISISALLTMPKPLTM